MSLIQDQEFKYRGFICSIENVEDKDGNKFYEFRIDNFEKNKNLDSILIIAIKEGIFSRPQALLSDFIGLTLFYPGDFAGDFQSLLEIGEYTDEGIVAAYSTENEKYKFYDEQQMIAKLKEDIDIYHEIRKKMIQAMRFNNQIAKIAKEVYEEYEDGNAHA